MMASAQRFAFLASHVKEFRLHLCQKSPSSLGVRTFIEKHYVDIKKSNPDLPILIRECSGIQPKLTARYSRGVEKTVSLADQSDNDVLISMETLAQLQ